MPVELLEELGRGGTGVVYRARHIETDKIIALKLLSRDIRSPEREVEMARRVHHRNVRQVYGLVHHHDEAPAISMEYVEGRTLKQFLQDSGPLGINDLTRIWRQILNGLEAIHAQGIVHRDLNLQNIFITRDGVVKLMDFGIARVQASMYTTPDCSGTPGYMAPEQVMGRPVDGRADLYALGFILYEMTHDSPGVPTHVESAIARCLERDPEQRFASVAELRRALARPHFVRRVPTYTGVLLLCLIATLSAARLVWHSARPVIPKVLSAPDAPPVAPQNDVPVVALVFDGPFGDAFAEALVNGGKYRVVDRSIVQKVLSELKARTTAGEIREARRVLGAAYFIAGNSFSYQGRLRINARMIETETSRVVKARGVEGDPKSATKLAEELAALF